MHDSSEKPTEIFDVNIKGSFINNSMEMPVKVDEDAYEAIPCRVDPNDFLKGPTVTDQLGLDLELICGSMPLCLLVSGVGSGKNYWIRQLAKKGYRVLLITSRRAIASEQLLEAYCDDLFPSGKIDMKKLRSKKTKLFVVTMSQIEKYVKNFYSKTDRNTHIWNYFNVIALDEAHSLVSDASFSDAPFYTEAFIRYAIKNPMYGNNTQFLMMTGTPDSLGHLINIDNDLDAPVSKYWIESFSKTINIMDKCRHVDPEEVDFIDSESVPLFLNEILSRKEKVIYFAKDKRSIRSIIDDLKKRGYSEDIIGIDYKNEKGEEDLFSEGLIKKRKKIQRFLSNSHKIPKDIQVFITTTKNKEGININNPDIHYMIAESTVRDELVQMAGRLRTPGALWNLYVVYDAYRGKETASDMFDVKTNKAIFEAKTFGAYDEYKTYTSGRGYTPTKYTEPVLTREEMERKCPLIRYNPFTEQYEWYLNRELSYRQRIENTDYLNKCVHYFTKEDRKALQSWFPYSKVETKISKKHSLNQNKLIQKEIITLLSKYSIAVGDIILKETKEKFVADFQAYLTGIDYRSLGINNPMTRKSNQILEKFGLSFTKKSGGNKFLVERVTEDGKKDSTPLKELKKTK